MDVEFPKQYFYDIRTNELYEKNKKITADKLINDVYNKHIKSTRPIKGLFIRMKIRFWRILMKSMFDIISKFFHHLLFIISGNRYSYEPVLETETLNDLRFKKTEKPKMKEKLKEGKKFNFYGYEASQWSIVFYSLLHFLLYVYFMYSGYKPIFITTIFKNNFLVIIYAILSLWIIETVMQTFLMFLIKYFSRLSADSLYGAIKL